MKLGKLQLFLILLLVLLFSSLGIGVLEGYGLIGGTIEGNSNIGDSSVSLNRAKNRRVAKNTSNKPDVRVEFKKLGREKKPMGFGSASGILKDEIPSGDEHLYVLKSQMVPPVCPACPKYPEIKEGGGATCPPCPGPERCPESAFTCKKVPNYSASAVDNILPSPLFHQGEGVQPILNSFAKFN